MEYIRNLIPYGKYSVDFEKAKIGDVIELKLNNDNKIAYGTILEKDNWNKLFVKFECENMNPSYAIIKCQTWYIFTDCHPCIEFDSNDKDWAIKHWNELKSNIAKEDAENIIKSKSDWLDKPLETKPIGNSDTMDKWAEYQSNVMGWNDR